MRSKKLFFILFVISVQVVSAQSKKLDSLRRMVKVMPEDSLKCETYLDIAYLLYSGEESELFAQKALRVAKTINSTRLIGKSYHRLAWCHGYDEVDKKTAYLDSATIKFAEINDYYGLGSVHDTRGILLKVYGSLDEAFLSFNQSLDYFSKIPDAEREASVLNHWAIAEYTGGNTEEALKKYLRALDFRLKETPKSHLETAKLYQGIGEVHRINGDLDLATINYLKGYDNRREVENIGVVESMLSIASMIYETAEKKVDTTEIVNIIKDHGFNGSLHLIQIAEKTKGVSDRIGFQNSIMDVKRMRFLLNKDFKAAYQLLVEQKKIQEEYKLSESSLEAMADMKVKFEKDQLKLQLLEEEVINQKSEDRMMLILFSLATLLLIAIIGLLYYQNRVKAGQLELSGAQREQQIVSMRSMLEGQEKERSRIARDLHDGLGNLLSSLKMNIGSLQINFDDTNSKKIYGSASQMIDEACTEVRKIAHEMMPQALKKLGLMKALEDLVLKTDALYDFDAEFHVHGEAKSFDDNTNVMLYRIVQEALNNIVKYSKAKEVLVQVNFSDEWFDLAIEDDGIGFEPDSVNLEKGMGLKSMAFRTDFIGGVYDINSRPGSGTLITINIPINK